MYLLFMTTFSSSAFVRIRMGTKMSSLLSLPEPQRSPNETVLLLLTGSEKDLLEPK